MLPFTVSSVIPKTRSLVSLKSRLLFQPRFSSSVHDSDPTLLEVEKRRNLERKQHLTSTTHDVHAPGWNEYLASTSEAHVKADKYGGDGPPTSELANQTVKRVLGRYGEWKGTRMEEEAVTYEKDEVRGPLRCSTAGTVNELHIQETHKKRTASNEDVKG